MTLFAVSNKASWSGEAGAHRVWIEQCSCDLKYLQGPVGVTSVNFMRCNSATIILGPITLSKTPLGRVRKWVGSVTAGTEPKSASQLPKLQLLYQPLQSPQMWGSQFLTPQPGSARTISCCKKIIRGWLREKWKSWPCIDEWRNPRSVC